MKVHPNVPPRMFTIGKQKSITLRDAGSITLEENELITFQTAQTAENGEDETPETRFDVTRTPFGYYATNSLNGTLPANNLRPALARNGETGLLFLLLVEPAKQEIYKAYLLAEAMDHLMWLDTLDPSMIALSDTAAC